MHEKPRAKNRASLFLSGLYRRFWNYTKSGERSTQAVLFADCTAGGELHPAPKTSSLEKPPHTSFHPRKHLGVWEYAFGLLASSRLVCDGFSSEDKRMPILRFILAWRCFEAARRFSKFIILILLHSLRIVNTQRIESKKYIFCLRNFDKVLKTRLIQW